MFQIWYAKPQVPETGFFTRSTPWLLARTRTISAKIPGSTELADEDTLGPLKPARKLHRVQTGYDQGIARQVGQELRLQSYGTRGAGKHNGRPRKAALTKLSLPPVLSAAPDFPGFDLQNMKEQVFLGWNGRRYFRSAMRLGTTSCDWNSGFDPKSFPKKSSTCGGPWILRQWSALGAF